MKNYKNLFLEIALLFATTIGVGLFSLPYIFKQAGFPIGIFYLIILAAIIIIAHYFYFQVLEATKEKKEGLIGLVRTYFGDVAEKIAFLIVVGGLILALVAHLILGSSFLEIFFPNNAWGIWFFWFVASIPIFIKLKYLKRTEFWATILIIGLIIYLAAFTDFKLADYNFLSFNSKNYFLPFGAVLFSLAGWPAIEPIFAKEKNQKKSAIKLIMAAGTALAALFYLIFVIIIFGLKTITPYALTGLLYPQLQIAGFLGLILVLVSYWPVGLEVKNGLERDLKWAPAVGGLTVIFSPLILYLLGLKNFLPLIGIVGGVFLSLQYLLILLVAKKSLNLGFWRKTLINFLSAVFILGAIYEIYYFIK